MKIRFPRPQSFPRPKLALCAAVTAVLLGATAHAQVNFSTTFLKMAGVSEIDDNQAAGYPWGGKGATWDGVAGDANDPYVIMASHGMNSVRIVGNYASKGPTDAAAKHAGLMVEAAIGISPTNVGQTDWNNATNSGADFTMDRGSTFNLAIETDVYNYVYSQLTSFNANSARIDLLCPGVEIDGNGFCGCPYGSKLFYQLLYDVGCATRDWDKANPGSKGSGYITGIVIHFIDISVSTYNECAAMVATNGSGKSTHVTDFLTGYNTIPFDCFGFSYHAWDNPLDNPAWTNSNGATVGLRQSFWNERLGHFGKWLLVQETSHPFLTDNIPAANFSPTNLPPSGGVPIIPSGGYYLEHHVCSDYLDCCGSYAGLSFGCTSKGSHDFLEAEMSVVANSPSGLGVGVCDWAGANLTGWSNGDASTWTATALNTKEYHFALWDSDPLNPGLVKDSTGTTEMSAFSHSVYTYNY